jgi:hypothetical protein
MAAGVDHEAEPGWSRVAWPSVTSVLVTVKLGTTGKRQNGSFIVFPPQ